MRFPDAQNLLSRTERLIHRNFSRHGFHYSLDMRSVELAAGSNINRQDEKPPAPLVLTLNRPAQTSRPPTQLINPPEYKLSAPNKLIHTPRIKCSTLQIECSA